MVAAGCCVVTVCSVLRPFERFELLTYDLRFALRPPLPSEDVVVIDIDDDTLANLGQWPLPRDFHASLVSALDELGARAIVFDLLFTEATVNDGILVQSFQRSGKVYLPMAFYIADALRPVRARMDDSPVLADITPALKAAARGVGHINTAVDSDGKVRRVPLFVKHQGKLVPQMAFKAACDQMGLNADNAVFKPGSVTIDGKLEVPLDADDTLLVNYPGTWKGSFKHYSYVELLKSYMDMKEGGRPAPELTAIKGKVCFVGLTAAGTSDLSSTPLENLYPMVGLQASVLRGIMQKAFIRDAGRPTDTGINLALFLLSALICWRLSPLRSLLAVVLLSAGFFALAVWLFLSQGIWIDLFLPLLSGIAAYSGAMVYKFFAEVKRRQLLEKEMEIAQAIQRSFLPRPLQGAGVSVAAFFQPAKFVAGDLYDVFKLDDRRVGIFIGDVAGKGVSAALVMAEAISVFRLLARSSGPCGEVLSHLNRELHGRLGGRFITALYLIVDTAGHTLSVAAAGHGPVLIFRREGLIDVPLEGRMPLGLMEDVEYPTVTFDLEEKDKIVIFSDGLIEARNKAGQEFGLERTQELIMAHAGGDSNGLLDAIQKEVLKFSEGNLYDDITLIVTADK